MSPLGDEETPTLLFTTLWRSGVKGTMMTSWYEGIVGVLICSLFW